MNITTAQKLVDRGAGVAHDRRHHLHLAEYDGQLWATNGYWLTPADWFGITLPALEVGTYDVKSKSKLCDDVPNLAAVWPKELGEEITPKLDHGCPVVLSRGTLPDLALFTFADGRDVALDRRYVDMVRTSSGASHRLVFRGRDPLKPVTVYRTTRDTYANGTSKDRETFVALIMPVRIS